MVATSLPASDADILLDVLNEGAPAIKPEVAEWLLTLRFSDAQQARMLDLADRNNAGTLSSTERDELFSYVEAGNTLAIWHSKARLALRGEPRSA